MHTQKRKYRSIIFNLKEKGYTPDFRLGCRNLEIM